MVHGYANEQELIRRWEATYKNPHLHVGHQPYRCAARTQGEAISSAPPISAATSTASMRNTSSTAGFDCLDMAGMDVGFR